MAGRRGGIIGDADRVVGGGHGDTVGRGQAGVVVRAAPTGYVPARGRVGGQGNHLPGDVLPRAATGGGSRCGGRIVAAAAVCPAQRVTENGGLFIDDADGVVGGGHGDAVGCGRASVVVRAAPAAHVPARGRRGGQGDHLAGDVLSRPAVGRLGRIGCGVGPAAAVAARQGVTFHRVDVLGISHADGVGRGGHGDAVGRGRAAVIGRAAPAGDAPAGGRGGGQGDERPGHVLPRRAAGRLGRAGRGVGPAAAVGAA